MIGIDCFNIGGGGGTSHLLNFMRVMEDIERSSRPRFFILCPKKLQLELSTFEFCETRSPAAYNRSLPCRLLYHALVAPRVFAKVNVGVTWFPGGIFLRKHGLAVTMCRNALPFSESVNHFLSFGEKLRWFLFKRVSYYSYKRSAAIIFLTEAMLTAVTKGRPELIRKSVVVPHGFPLHCESQNPTSRTPPFRICYNSRFEKFKCHVQFLRALNLIENTHLISEVILVGNGGPMFEKLRSDIDKLDITTYLDLSPREALSVMSSTDIAIFLSVCENLPNTVLEIGALGKPALLSSIQPMMDMLNGQVCFCDPEDPVSIALNLDRLLLDTVREPKKGSFISKIYNVSWKERASETLAVLESVS